MIKKKKRVATGKIINMEDIERGLGIKISDDMTRRTLSYLLDIAEAAEVDTTDITEMKEFCRYILLCFNKAENLLAYMEQSGFKMEDLEVSSKATIITFEGDKK